MRIILLLLSLLFVAQARSASIDFKSVYGTNGMVVTTNGIGLNQKLLLDGRNFQPANSNLTNWASISTNLLTGSGGTGEVSTAQLLNASNVLRSAQSSGDSSTLSSSITYTLATSNSIVSGLGGGSGGGGVALAPTNIPSATSFTVNALWQVSCVSLAHNATVVLSNISVGQIDAMLIVTNTGAFTLTLTNQFGAGQWEGGIIPALPANRTATIFFSRPTTGVTNIYMRGQDLLLAVASPSAIGTNATTLTITNLLTISTNNPFGAPVAAGNVSELLFSNGINVAISGRRATVGMETMGGGGGASSVETNITVTTTNNVILDFNAANIFRIELQTNWTETYSNMASLTSWPTHRAYVYYHMGTNGGYILNNFYVDGGIRVTNQNQQPTTNANALDIIEVGPSYFQTNAFTSWQRDYQPRIAVQSFSISNNLALWLVVDDLTALADNTQVSRFTNRMAGFLSFTNGLAGVIKSNSVVNGHAAIYFDGVGFLNSELGTGWGEYVGAESATIFIVMRQRSTDHQNCLFQWIASGESIELFATYDDVIYWEMPNNGPSGSINGPQPIAWDDAWHVVELVRGSDTAQILVDGAVVATGTPSANFTVGDSSVLWYLGSTSGGGTAFNGDMAEVRIYNDAKSSTDRTTIRASLKATYNTP